ncbi:type IV secretory system conjugative DNA transfer family protein [Demequina sp.]|uniref:type IV secretory system conjugative DNA transfer family protein n=1 Tax=Demequina sp. TaxID=2050685 RepID=UPI003D09B662
MSSVQSQQFFSPSEKLGWTAAGVAISAVGLWHVALAVATPGHGLGDLGATIGAALAGHPLAPDGATGPTNIAVLVTVLVVAIAALAVGMSWWASRRRGRAREGLAAGSRITATVRAKDAHAQLIGYDGKRPVRVRAEDAGLMIAPPRAGKTTTRVIAAVIEAPGACVATSTKGEVLHLTHALRATKGAIHVFDPEGASNWPELTTWNVVDGCDDPVEATERARAMVKAVTQGEGGNIEFFVQAAQTVLSCYLHAAALEGYTIDKVVSWAKNTRNQEPYEILADNSRAAANWHEELTTYTRGDAGPTIQSVTMTISNVLACLRTGPAIAAVRPSRREFNVDAFLASSDTLYLMSNGGEGSAAPLTTALVATIERRARVLSQRHGAGRFTVPVTLVLDEAPNIAALPNLPGLITDSGGRGMIVWCFSQSYAQLEGRWGHTGAETMLNGAAVLMVLGGIKEVELLERLAKLSGERRVERRTRSESRDGSSSSTSTEWEQNLRLDNIRRLPQGRALVWYLNHPPAEVTLMPFWRRPDAKLIEQSRAEAERLEGIRS